MDKMVRIEVARFDPARDEEALLVTYRVPAEPGGNVLGALQYIYEQVDPTLAFRYDCRSDDCGLCAVDVSGRPRLACTTPLKQGQVIRPLQRLPVVRDLMVDRDWMLPFQKRFALFLPDRPTQRAMPRVSVSEQFARLATCTECLSCLAACPSYEHGQDDIGGPYHFVKLAQLHWDPRDEADRCAQAAELGISRCASCRKCACPLGIPVYKMAVAPLATLA